MAVVYFMALDLNRYRLSAFELRTQLAHRSDQKSRLLRQINKYISEIATLRTIDTTSLLIVLAGLLAYLEQSLVGIPYALGAAMLAWLIARIPFMRDISAVIFERHAIFICQLAQRGGPILRFIQRPSVPQLAGSKAELLDSIQTMPSTVLLPIERQRLELVLQAEEKTVQSIMTPKKRVVMVEPSATLGPIVLSDLQKSGHGYFPVATKKGEPEGILTLSDVADIQQAKQRSSVRELMSSHVAWVEENTSLYGLAEAFLDEKQYIILVRNLEGEFSGIVTIADLMKHVLGVVKE